ncbi:MAG: alpha/beta hydrolase [Rudanella sp.]|nr:alpha/beta hydrolase [Rudanella sp.]
MKNIHALSRNIQSRIALFHKHALFGFVCLTLVSAVSCQDHALSDPAAVPGRSIQSGSPKPDWGPTITPQMLAIIEEAGRQNPIPLTQLTAQEARMKPSIKDAVNALLSRNGIAVPAPAVDITNQTVGGANGASLRALVVKPRGLTGPLPVLVYFHGGGWVIANADVYESSAVGLALKTGTIVVSVDYRLAPENKFPIAHEDAYAAYLWVRANAASLGGNPAKIAVGGESAGGNLSVGVSLLAKERGQPLPIHQLLVYPVANNDLNTESYIRYQNAKPLSKPLIIWFVDKYFRTLADGDDRLISLTDVANLSGLPPATIIGAEIDPLQTEGKQLADKFQLAGVPVRYQLYTGVTH